MGKPRTIEKGARVAKEATNILKEGYKKQVAEQRMRYSSGQDFTQEAEDNMEKVAGRGYDGAKRGTQSLVKSMLKTRGKKTVSPSGNTGGIPQNFMRQRIFSNRRRPVSGTQNTPAAAQRRTLSIQTAKKRLMIKRGNELKTRQQQAQKMDGTRAASTGNTTPASQPAPLPANTPKTPEAVKGQPAASAPSNLPKTAQSVQGRAAGTSGTHSMPHPQAPRGEPIRAGTPTAKSLQGAGQPTQGGAHPHRQRRKAAPKMKKQTADTVHRLKKSGVQKAKKVEAKTRKTAAKAFKNKATQRMRHKAQQQAMKQTAKATAKVIKATARMIFRVVKLVVKAAAALVRALFAALGPLAAIVVIIVIVAAIASVLASNFGVFFSGEDTTPEVTPIPEIVAELNAEFAAKIEKIKQDHSYCDEIKMHYLDSADGVQVNNWFDVIAVFAVKTAIDDENGLDVVTMDSKRIELLKIVFWDMNQIDYEVEKIKHKDDGETWYEYILHIYITNKNAEQQAHEYGFTEEQKALMREMLSGYFTEYFYLLLGVGPTNGGGLTDEELEEIINNLPPGEYGSAVVEIALTRLGDPYSIPLAGTGSYTDCSHLVQWAYAHVGIDLPRRASIQAKELAEGGRAISKSDLEPGDLIFWSYEANGFYRNIGHVGIYAGDGKVIHASSVEMCVVIEPLFHADRQVMYGRP